MSTATWRKSSFSSDEDNANCVELAACPTCTSVRDSKNPDGPTLQFPESGWRTFLLSSKA
jgi:hypothetical protein